MAVLYIVATPIGNLEDITRRAIRVLGEVEAIACEDTRRSKKLLEHYRIKKPLISYHAHNRERAARRVFQRLKAGDSVALITDGGTPGISDPGAHLVRRARSEGFSVVPIPGPSALTALLSVAGSGTSGITFAGFLSSKPGKRRKRLEELLESAGGFVLFESPHRILKLLAELERLAPDRKIFLGREMTKLHEEFLEGIPDVLLTELSEKAKIVGEFALFVVPDKKVQVDSDP